MDLIIVESPTKSKTLKGFLGKNYEVVATMGHVRDLPKSNKKAIDIPGGFVPNYELIKGKEKIVGEIKKASKKAVNVFIATDPDREGEAIAWHIKELCGFKNPDRIVFHEITKNAIEEAIGSPRKIDEDLTRAQEARRVLDRLVGYDLSGLIWKKVRYGLSAGRVQSPALRIIMEKEREIRAFSPEDYWSISGIFSTGKREKITLVCSEEPKAEKEAEEIIAAAKKGKWEVIGAEQSEKKRTPRAPFITSTLQQTASSRLGYSPSRTMSIAQKLYEQGLITYMRTDSVNVSKEALPQIYKTIEKNYGKEYLFPRKYFSKSKSAQEAHEAIRPTDFSKKFAGSSEDQKKLYKLIWERTVSSQMADAKMLGTKISANIIGEKGAIPDFSATGSVIVFPGWLAADVGARGEDAEFPKISKGDALKLDNIESEGKQTQPPSRYTEAGLVKELEKREIGRPSTYASIIKTIIDRGYVYKEGKALRPSDTGEVVSGFLESNFSKYISDSFTAEMENELDEIAEGKRKYGTMLKNFYGPFSKEVKIKGKTAEKITNLGEAGEEHKCPVCDSPMIIKLSRNGKFLSCKKFPECVGARKMDGSIMEGPKETGEKCPQCGNANSPAGGGKLVEREGRFGKFISCSNYPKCKFIKKSPEQEAKERTGVKCPKCSEGEVLERRGRFGFFYSCSRYPQCDFIMKSKPTGKKCEFCGALMMEGSKTIPDRCSDKNCPNYNPHKMNKTKKAG
jgi:DNA topoisomerase-1